MKKRLKRISLFLGVAALGVAASVSLLANSPKDAVGVYAIDIPASTNLYLQVNDSWRDAGARFAVYFYVGEDVAWVDMVLEDTDPYIYKGVSPDDGKNYTNLIFCRMNPGTTENNWVNKWNQTGDLVFDGSNNLFTLPTSGDYIWNGATTTWSTYTARSTVTLTATTEGISSSKARIWVDRSGHYENDYTWALKIGSTRYQPTGFEKALKLDETNDRWFPYYDLPISVLTGNISISIVNSLLKVVVEVPEVAYSAGNNSEIWKVDYVSEAWSITKGAITQRIYNTFFAKVLEGYLSCSDSEVNGYMAFGSIDENFLPRTGEPEVWNMEGDLAGNLIADYETQANYDSGTREAVVSTDAFAKYEFMRVRYEGSSGAQIDVGYFSNDSYVALIIAIALIGLTSIAGLYILKKKRA
ncbi:MAG: hypothetical protein PHU55_01295 [Bacilli bacterium]|nr:hypothetical protein [Bacilli bacterium]